MYFVLDIYKPSIHPNSPSSNNTGTPRLVVTLLPGTGRVNTEQCEEEERRCCPEIFSRPQQQQQQRAGLGWAGQGWAGCGVMSGLNAASTTTQAPAGKLGALHGTLTLSGHVCTQLIGISVLKYTMQSRCKMQSMLHTFICVLCCRQILNKLHINVRFISILEGYPLKL